MAVSNPEVVGGIPLVSALGTPRAMGEALGQRLKPRLQVLAQYLLEQLVAALQARGSSWNATSVREQLREALLPATRVEPSLGMELESMAAAAGLPAEDLLLIHGYGDLLSRFGCQVAPTRSTYIGLGPGHTDTGQARLVLSWHLDPALLPYMTLVRRIPAHGPASLSLTLAGLHPVVGMSEARIAVASNEMRVNDGEPGQFISHLVASALTAPAPEDAISRLSAGPRTGGAAVHVLAANGDRATVELSGRHQVRLLDPFPKSPRVHTNHPLSEVIQRQTPPNSDGTSRPRLERLANLAIDAEGATPQTIANWFGLGEGVAAALRTRSGEITGVAPETTVLIICDPERKDIHVKRGGSPARLETVHL
jgi:hypothetical protein